MPSASAEQARDTAPDDRVVVDEQDPDHCHVIPRHGARDAYRTARRRRRRRLAASRRSGAARRASAGTHDGQHAALPGRGLDAQVAAGQLRALAHADDAEVAPAGERRRGRRAPRSRSPSSAIVSTARAAEPAQAHVDAGRVRVALDVAQRLAQDPLQLARRRRRRSSPDVLDREVEPHAVRARPARRLGPERGRAAAARRRRARAAPVMISRASRVAWRASSASRRASAAAPSGSRSIRRESASAAKPMPETVLASESCMSRASRARSASAASGAPARRAPPRPPPGGRAAAARPAPAAADERVQRRQADDGLEVRGTGSTPGAAREITQS